VGITSRIQAIKPSTFSTPCVLALHQVCFIISLVDDDIVGIWSVMLVTGGLCLFVVVVVVVVAKVRNVDESTVDWRTCLRFVVF
jgi:ABC-type nickel/cobalt efflux system permease component RcnA